MRGRLGSVGLLAASVAAALLVAEGVLRWRLDPVDYLEPELDTHPVLGRVIVPGSGGHDAWGFRNLRVPERTAILAVGDSQTYGVSAPARQSWPAWLGRLSGRSVYNLALGGYGPPDYLYLLRERGVSLHPEIAVFGFYLGNDLPRAGGDEGAQAARVERRDARRRFLGGLRSRLARKSLLYQVIKFELPALADALRFREAARRDDVLAVEHPVSRSFLQPEYRLAALDLSLPANRRGLEAAFAAFRGIRATCAERGIRCLVLLIPTKESVYWELAREGGDASGYASLERLVAEEEAVQRALVRELQALDLESVDPLPALRAAVRRERIYLANADGHPNGAGYRVLARSVLAAIEGEAP